MDITQQIVLPDGPGTITPFSLSSIGMAGALGTPASTAYPVALDSIFIPFRVSRQVVTANAFWYNGSTVSATYHLDVGIFDTDGVNLGSLGQTNQGSANVIQTAALSVKFGPGIFYLGIDCDNILATLFAATTITLQAERALGMLTGQSVFPLPAIVTYANLPTLFSTSYVPVFGVTIRSFV